MSDACAPRTTTQLPSPASPAGSSRLEHLLEHLPGGVVAANAQTGRFVYANNVFCQMLGYSPEEVLELTPGDIQAPESAELVRLEFARAMAGEPVHVRDILVRRKDGSTFHADIRTTSTELDGKPCVLGFFADVSSLQRANDELDHKTALMSSLLEAMPDLVFWKDTNCNYIDCNEEFARRLGVPKDQVTGKSDADLYPPDLAAAFTDDDRRILEGGPQRRSEGRLPNPDGSITYTEVVKLPLRSASGELLGLLGLVRDITDRKLAEAERERGSRLRDLLMEISGSFIGVAPEDLDACVDRALARLGEFVCADRAYVFDYVWREGICSNTHEWCSEGVTPEIENLRALPLSCVPGWPEAHRAGQDVYIPDVLALPPGPVREILVPQGIKSLVTVPIGLGDGCLGFVGFDFVRHHREYSETDRRLLRVFSQMLASVHLRHRAERDYRTFFSAMLEGMSVHDIIVDEAGKPVDYRFVAVNPAFERMTGLRAQDVIGRRVLEVLPRTEPVWIERFGHVALTGEPRRFTEHSGELGKTVEVTAFRPAPGQFACMFQDVTDRVRAKEEARRLQEQLLQAQKMESIGRLAGGVAHDFNNMLSVIIGHSELALDKLSPGSQAALDVQEVLKAAHRSAELTRQLLAFARRQAVAPRVLDLNAAVESMLKMLRRLIGEHVELEWRPAPGPALVRIDPAQLDQVLANLAVNARDAISLRGGKVSIATAIERVLAGAPARVPGLQPGEHVVLHFADDGCGMDEKVLAHLYEPFYTTKEVGRGTGLGLATVHGIVLQNGGAIDVRSAPGKGTQFAIYFPRCTHEGATATPPTTSSANQGSEETILLVEDEPTILDLARRVLARQGYRVIAAPSPEEALRLSREHDSPIHLLVTDVIMPGMNGRDLAAEMSRSRPGLRVLFMSGYTSDILSAHGIAEEGAAFLQKPFRVKDLAAKVSEILGHPATA